MIRVYLDTSVYNRPLDDQTQPKIFLETQAVVLILQLIEENRIELVSSTVLEYENSKNPFPLKQQMMNRYLQIAKVKQEVSELIQYRAKALEENGLKVFDALHVACAEISSSNYFITCDKRLVNRYTDNIIRVLNPVDFILELEDNDAGEK